MFDKRKQVEMQPEPVAQAVPPRVSLELRDERDPDPMIEEMAARLRGGLSRLEAYDEWGRPLAWRNVVRLAVGPMVSQLRDTQTAAEIATTMLAAGSEPVAEPLPALLAEPVALEEEQPEVQGHLVGWPSGEQPGREPLPEPATEPAAEEPAAEEPAAVVEPEAPPATQSSSADPRRHWGQPYDASIFRPSGDQRAVPVSPFGAGQVLGQRGAHDASLAQYDRFLAGLYGQRQQVRGDQDRGAGGAGLGDDLQGGVHP